VNASKIVHKVNAHHNVANAEAAKAYASHHAKVAAHVNANASVNASAHVNIVQAKLAALAAENAKLEK
jgi:hypothetical protein